MFLEPLEGRQLLAADLTTASPWQNVDQPLDTNADGSVSPIDVLVIVNDLNAQSAAEGETAVAPNPSTYPDVNGDSAITPADADLVIDSINSQSQSLYGFNSPPEAYDDWYMTPAQTTLTEVLPGVLLNDYDLDGDALTASLISGPASGVLNYLNSDGSFEYVPNPGFAGTDSFVYEASDGTDTAQATVYVDVTNSVPEPTDDGPFMITCNCDPDEKTGNVADNDGLTADGDNWKDGDGDSVTFVLVDNVTNGTLTFDTDTGEFKYVQNEGFLGDDSFTYEISDGLGTSTYTATVRLSVVGMIAAPTAENKIEGSVTVDGNATSSAAKGTTPAGVTTTDAKLIYWKYYYKQYDGPTEFTADYTVNLKPDGSFDPDGSTVKLTTKNYTFRKLYVRNSISPAQEASEVAKGSTIHKEGGKVYILKKAVLKPKVWSTLSIPITSATLVDGKLESFEFKSDKWYGNPPNGLIDKGIEGQVDLEKCKADFTAKYQEPIDGSIATYVTKGKIKN